MGVFSHILLRAKRPCMENTTIIKQTMSVSFNEIKTARNVGAREEKHSGELSPSLSCASVRYISLRAVCVCLSHARKHTPRALLRSVNVQCCACIISVLGDLRPFSLSAKQEGFYWSFQMDVTHTRLILNEDRS